MRQIQMVLVLVLFLEGSVSADEFEVGQVWKYDSRASEENSTLTIGRIDRFDDQTIVHVSLSGLRISMPAQNRIVDSVGHLPIEAGFFKESLKELVGQSVPDDQFAAGYEYWRAAYDEGNAGYYTLPLRECVETIEAALNGTAKPE